MIDRETILSTTNADERFFILHQQKTKKEASEAWSKVCEAEDNNTNPYEIGRLQGEYAAATKRDNEAWAVLEKHLSLTQRRIILDCGEITPEELLRTTASINSMWDRDAIMDTLTTEEREIVEKWEMTGNCRDEYAGKLNDLIDNCLNEDPTKIGKAYQKFQRAEDAETEAHDALCERFTRFQRRVIYHCQPWL